MTDESKRLREAIRSGEIDPQKNRPQWEWAVARIYEVERAAAESRRGMADEAQRGLDLSANEHA